MTNYSDDARINALFMDAEQVGELDDAMYAHQWDPDLDPEEGEDRPVTMAELVEDNEAELERDAQSEVDALDDPAQETWDEAPDAFLDAQYEDRYAMYDDDPSPYDGNYSEM